MPMLRRSIRQVATQALRPRLLGRADEIATLNEALDRVASGRLAVVLLDGEAGIGKTRLLEHALTDAQARGMQVVAGRAEELERNRPFGLLASAFGCTALSPDPRRADIASLLAIHGGNGSEPITVTSDPGLQFRAVDAFGDLVEELALAGPVVISVDDLQWADPSSLLTLGAVGRRFDYPVGLIGCFRPSPRVADLERLVDALEAAGAQHLRVSPLADGAVHDLVAESVAAEPGPALLAEISGTAGNPLFIIELVGALLQEGAIQTADGQADVARSALPPTLRLTIMRRLSFLSDDTLRALRPAAILGSRFTLADLATVTNQPAVDLSLWLQEAIRAHVVGDDGASLRFRHDLIRDAIYEDLPGSVRRGLHRETGQRLARAGAPALQVAEHLARAATPGDAEAVSWLTRAAREAASTSPQVAADLTERAIDLTAPADPGRDRLVAEQASYLMGAGRVFDVEQVCQALLHRSHDPGAGAAARLCLGLALLASGRPRDALRELEQATQSPLLTAVERATGLGWASIARMWLGDLDGAATTAEQTRTAAAAAGDDLATSIGMAMFAVVSYLRGQLHEAIQVCDDAVRLADQSPGRQGHRYPIHAPRGFVLVELDRLEEARSTLETGTRISEELGIRWHLASYQMARAFERYAAGEWDDAVAEIDASFELAAETGEAYGLIITNSLLSLISLHRNDIERAREAAATAVSEFTQTGARYRAHWSLAAHALVLEADGKIEDAYAALADVWDQCTQLGIVLEHRVFGADLVRLALATGDRARARDVAAAVSALAERNDVPSLTGIALRCRGLAADDSGILAEAAKVYARAARPLEHALACEDAGAIFARRGNLDRARPLLERALTIYERLDAARDLARTEAVLREAGIRRGRRGRRGRPQTGWQSITTTERTIASLVAEGLSNPQIGDRLYISRRTVQTHLAHMFVKLDVGSRAELAAQVAYHRGRGPT